MYSALERPEKEKTTNAIGKGDYNPTIRLCLVICHMLDKTLDEFFWEEA